MSEQTLNEMAHAILDTAETFTQTRGFNGFSYKDIQQEVGIKTSSIHYYFPAKQDLAVAMAERYIERFRALLDSIDARDLSAIEKLSAMGEPFLRSAKQEKFCLCGMLFSDIQSLPEEASMHLRTFFKISAQWIAQVLRQGIKDGEIRKNIKAESASAHFLAALEGGLLMARLPKNAGYMQVVLDEALTQLKA